jgi:hypothetical protein
MLVAAELTLHGRPAFIVPVGWPGYDVVAELPGAALQRISVKSRDNTRFIDFDPDTFDWLAVVLFIKGQRRFFVIPKEVANAHSHARDHKNRKGGPRGLLVSKILKELSRYEDNFKLQRFAP